MNESYTRGPTDVPQIEATIGDNLVATAERFGEREALVDLASGCRWTYRELVEQVDSVALGLWAAGVRPGDRVGIWALSCPEWVLTQYATARIGAILVTVNPAYRTHELSFVIGQSGMRMMIAMSELRGVLCGPMIEDARAGHESLVDVVTIGDASWNALLDGGVASGLTGVDELGLALGADDPINIQYTSGTTGFPKGATLSHRNILNNGFFVGELLDYCEQDRICIPVPFYHCFGMVMGNLAATSHGAAMIIPSPSFDPVASLHATASERCTSLYGVPTMFIAMLEALEGMDALNLSALRTGIMAGASCPVETMKQVMDVMGMTGVSICYGMTETSPVSLQTRSDDSIDRRVSTVGRVGPHLEVKVVDPMSNAPVERGVAGELCTRGYSVMIGYWNEPEKTAESIDSEGWMHTGDLGVMDEDGYVSITGRIKDLVIRGGENISPREVEEYLMTHPHVIDAQVIGVPDPKYGEELMAWLRLREGVDPIDAATLREFCAGDLAHYKIPRYVHVVDEFPMTMSGKVRKVEMREEARTILGLSGD